MLRKLGLLLVVGVAVVLAFAATRPDTFRVERTITINAAPGTLFPLINDFQGWALWSPWERKDPEMKRTYQGSATGVGAVYEWSGNRDVGSGRMEIIQSVPDAKVAVDLHFTAPFEARNTAEFILAPKGDSTTVTWVMFGPAPLLSKVIGLFVSMDQMIGGDFENGLKALKAAAEGRR